MLQTKEAIIRNLSILTVALPKTHRVRALALQYKYSRQKRFISMEKVFLYASPWNKNCLSKHQENCFNYFIRIIKNYFYSGSNCNVNVHCKRLQLSFLLENIFIRFGKASIDYDYSRKKIIISYSRILNSQIRNLIFFLDLHAEEKNDSSLTAVLSEGELICVLSESAAVSCVSPSGNQSFLPVAEGSIFLKATHSRLQNKYHFNGFNITRMSVQRARKCSHMLRNKMRLL